MVSVLSGTLVVRLRLYFAVIKFRKALSFDKTGKKKRATYLAKLMQNELKSDVARFTAHVQTS